MHLLGSEQDLFILKYDDDADPVDIARKYMEVDIIEMKFAIYKELAEA